MHWRSDGCSVVEKMAWQALGQLLLASKQLKGSCEQQKVLRAVVLYRGCKGAVRAGPVFVGGAAEGATQPIGHPHADFIDVFAKLHVDGEGKYARNAGQRGTASMASKQHTSEQ